MFGFVTLFPTLYIPILNHQVFKHTGISWEWGIVFVATGLFFAGVESWKWAKRVFFRRQARQSRGSEWKDLDVEQRVFGEFLASRSPTEYSESDAEKSVKFRGSD